MKALIHHTSDDPYEFREILCWLGILIDQGVEEIAVVSHGNGINLFTKDSAAEEAFALTEKPAAVAADRGEWGVNYLSGHSTREEKFESLAERNVSFRGCETALASRGLTAEDMVDPLEVVPSGITEIIRLQTEGFQYATYPSQYGGIPEQYSA